MLTRLLRLLLVLFAGIPLAVVGCGPPETDADASHTPVARPDASWPANAADAYMGILSQMDEDRVRRICDAWDVERFPPVYTDLVTMQPQITQLITASHIDRADWSGYRKGRGIQMSLDYISPLRSASLVLAADAVRLIERGQHAAAAERLSAVMRLGRHASADGPLIQRIVGAAVISIALHQIDGIGEDERRPIEWSPTSRRILTEEIRSFDLRDPANIVGAFAFEAEMIRASLLDPEGLSAPRSRRDTIDQLFAELAKLSMSERRAGADEIASILARVPDYDWGDRATGGKLETLELSAQTRAAQLCMPAIALAHEQSIELSQRLKAEMRWLENR